MEKLEEKGIDFVSLTEGIDTPTAQGRLTFHIFGALAEFAAMQVENSALTPAPV
jgi:DNA invertase Pin-like site-specific DNA recombinase